MQQELVVGAIRCDCSLPLGGAECDAGNVRCKRCGAAESRVLDSRPSQDAIRIRRRRECEGCGFRWSTLEAEEVVPLRVLKKDGRRQPLEREKILRGIERACEKRPIPYETLEAVADGILQGLSGLGEKEIPAAEIGDRVLHALRQLDAVAYVRFMSVYRQFDTVEDFIAELSTLVERDDERRSAACGAGARQVAGGRP